MQHCPERGLSGLGRSKTRFASGGIWQTRWLNYSPAHGAGMTWLNGPPLSPFVPYSGRDSLGRKPASSASKIASGESLESIFRAHWPWIVFALLHKGKKSGGGETNPKGEKEEGQTIPLIFFLLFSSPPPALMVFSEVHARTLSQ